MYLQKSVLKIPPSIIVLQLVSAYDNSYAMSYIKIMPGKTFISFKPYDIMHIKSNSQIQKNYHFNNEVRKIAMVNEE